MSTLAERECVSIFLKVKAVEAWPPASDGPVWRFLLWAVLHPFQYQYARGSFYALRNAADAIDNDDHLLEMGKLLAQMKKGSDL